MEWTADVKIGRSHATITGSGSVNLGDVVSDAMGAQVTLSQVVVTSASPNEFMIGYDLGSARNMIATVVISIRE